jgi:hypothetical protein
MSETGSSKAEVLRDVLRRFSGGEKVAPAEFQEFVKAQNDDAQSGLEVGAKIPEFALTDQDGMQRSFSDLTGPEGLLLVFTRSADW